MGAPKDLNNPAVYAEALVRAVLDPNRDLLAAWLSGAEELAAKSQAAYPFKDWYLYFADRLLDMMPHPEWGFQSRPKRSVAAPRIGRNDPCPCGSGKKYKQCHLEQEERPDWKLGSPTPVIRAMAVSKLVHELPPTRLDKVPLDLAPPVALTEMASVFQAQGRLEEALALVKRVLDGDRQDPFLLYDYWIARYAEWLVEAGREKEGEQFLMDEYDAPRHVKAWQVAQKLAAFYIDQGDLENASTWVDTALEGDADNPFNHYLKGMLAHFDELWDAAVASYQQALHFSDNFREEEQAYMQHLVHEALQRARNHLSLEDEEEAEAGDDTGTDGREEPAATTGHEPQGEGA
ncbi:MAG: SEC-C metal-binding domain-containing protein [Magnetococcus sp. MYC-9]